MLKIIITITFILLFLGCGGRHTAPIPIQGYFTPGLRVITADEKQAFSQAYLKYKQEKARKGTSYADKRLGYSLTKFYSYIPAAAKLYIDKDLAHKDTMTSEYGLLGSTFADYSNTAYRTLLKDLQFDYLDNFWWLLNSNFDSVQLDLTLALSADDWIVHNDEKRSHKSAKRLANYYSTGCVKVTVYNRNMYGQDSTAWGSCKPNRAKENYYFRKMLNQSEHINANIEFAIASADFYFKYQKNDIAAWWYAAAADLTDHTISQANTAYVLKDENLAGYLSSSRLSQLSGAIDAYNLTDPLIKMEDTTTFIDKLQMLVDAGMTTPSPVYSQRNDVPPKINNLR